MGASGDQQLGGALTFASSYDKFGLLIAQIVKNPPAMQETWVQFLGPKDPLENR